MQEHDWWRVGRLASLGPVKTNAVDVYEVVSCPDCHACASSAKLACKLMANIEHGALCQLSHASEPVVSQSASASGGARPDRASKGRDEDAWKGWPLKHDEYPGLHERGREPE